MSFYIHITDRVFHETNLRAKVYVYLEAAALHCKKDIHVVRCKQIILTTVEKQVLYIEYQPERNSYLISMTTGVKSYIKAE